MSKRGEIIVECDTPGCHSELIVTAAELCQPLMTLGAFRVQAGWATYLGKDQCDACVVARIKEGKL